MILRTKNFFSEEHGTIINSNVRDVWSSLISFDFHSSFLIKLLFNLRGLKVNQAKSRLKNLWSQSWINMFASGFHPIEILEPKHLVLFIGIAPKNFLNKSDLPLIGRHSIINTYSKIKKANKLSKIIMPYYFGLNIYWTFRIQKIDSDKSYLYTKTEIEYKNIRTKKLFTFYWIFIKFFSSAIRYEILRLIKNDAESTHENITGILN